MTTKSLKKEWLFVVTHLASSTGRTILPAHARDGAVPISMKKLDKLTENAMLFSHHSIRVCHILKQLQATATTHHISNTL